MLTYPELVVCEECDAMHAWRPLRPGDVARCTRCGAVLGRSHRLAIDGQLALALAALVVFVIGNVSPIVTLELRGLRSVLSLHEALIETWNSGPFNATRDGLVSTSRTTCSDSSVGYNCW